MGSQRGLRARQNHKVRIFLNFEFPNFPNLLAEDFLVWFIRFALNTWALAKARRNGRTIAAVTLMILLWLVTWALTVSPDLHHFLHQDSQTATHACLITQLHQHPPLVVVVALVAPPPTTTPFEPSHGAEFCLPDRVDYRLSPSRAPPSA